MIMCLDFPLWCPVRRDMNICIFFPYCIPQHRYIKKIFNQSMFEKYILYIFIRYIEMYVYFGFTVSLKAYGEVIIFKILFCAIKIILRHTHHPEHFSAFDAHNPEHFSVAHNAEK
jgi:hypothetical protein